MRRLLIAGLVVAAILAAGLAALRFGSGPLLARYLDERLEAETGYRWTIALRPGLALWPEPGLVLNDVDARVDLEGGASASIRVPVVRLSGALAALGDGGRIGRVELERPEVRLPREMWRHLRARAPAAERTRIPAADHVGIRGGTLFFVADGRDVRTPVSEFDLDAVADARSGVVSIKSSGRVGGETLRSEVVVEAAAAGSVPVRFTLDVPRLSGSAIAGTAVAAAEGAVVTFSRLSGSVGPNRFTGALVLDATAKPSVRLDLGFPAVSLAAASGGGTAWRLTPDGFDALRDFDGRLRLHAGRVETAALPLSDVSAEAQLRNGAVTLSLLRADLYGGEAQGSLTLTPSNGALNHAARLRVKDVRGLPFLSDVAGFALLDGLASASLDVRGTGWTSEEAVRTLAGEAEVEVRQGRLNQLNLPTLAQLLVGGLSASPDRGDANTTAFDRFSARFRIENGRATTGDMSLRGPIVEATGAGTVDIPEKTLAFRINPKLVGGSNPSMAAVVAGFGIPVVVEGPWSSPRAYADLGGAAGPAGAAPGAAPDASPLGALLGKDSPLGALLDAIVPNARPPQDCGPNCRNDPPFGQRRPGAGRP